MGLAGFGGLSHAAQPQEVVITSLDATPLKAWVFYPTEVSGTQRPKDVKRGTVVALHGCGGLYATGGARKVQLNARHQAMADLLVEQG